MPGQKLYHAADASPCTQQQPSSSKRGELSQLDQRLSSTNNCSIWRRCTFHTSVRSPRNWNVFLGTRSHGHDQSLESPVYSLSRPSSVSPTIYAGVQDCIMQLDLVSVLDQHPDSIYGPRLSSNTISYTPPSHSASTSAVLRMGQRRETDAAVKRWDPERQVMSLPMYEQADRVSTFYREEPSSSVTGRFVASSFRGPSPIAPLIRYNGYKDCVLNLRLLQIVLMHQQPVRSTCSKATGEGTFQGLDERWGGASVREES